MLLKGEDLREGNSPSWFNAVETVKVVTYLHALLNNEKQPVQAEDIGVITPYRKQVHVLCKRVKLLLVSSQIGDK